MQFHKDNPKRHLSFSILGRLSRRQAPTNWPWILFSLAFPFLGPRAANREQRKGEGKEGNKNPWAYPRFPAPKICQGKKKSKALVGKAGPGTPRLRRLLPKPDLRAPRGLGSKSW